MTTDHHLLSDILPLPNAKFQGEVGRTYTDSQPDVPQMPSAPANAPNILIVLLDDIGFGQSSTFGGPVNMPILEKLAQRGLRYNRFHTTALCSPTRAALLTGRNHHSVHTGIIMELATGYPGYDGVWPKETACVAETLRQNAYNTAAFGKWHNTPDYELSTAGPFDRWPTGLGFEYFFGFLGGEANQWDTPLTENTQYIEKPVDDPNWHFSTAIADKAISWIQSQKAAAPTKPFFAYFAPGCGHAPHHVSKEWSDQYKGKFDHGWDRQREITFEKQKELGVIPADTQLTPRPGSIPSWDSRSEDEKRLYTRMQEVFAGFLEHADHQIGRVVDAIAAMGQLDNTLIIYIVGDNGPSAEGTLTGTLNNMKSQQGFVDDVEEMLAHIDEIGGPLHENHYPVGWCWAGSSPLQWMKQVASHFGGTRNGMVISWPEKIKDCGGLRSQFHHVIDIAPTLLEVAGIPEPRMVNGVPQKLIEGVSLAYTFDGTSTEGRRKTQYFEMFGNRALYHDGWVAGARHGKLPWTMSGSAPDFDADVWELYNVEADFSQSKDLAAQEPKKLRELQDLFYAEAAKYNVLPLDDRLAERADMELRPNYTRGINRFVFFPGTVRLPEGAAPNVKNRNHVIAAELEIPPSGAEGVIQAIGGATGGYTLFIQSGKLIYDYNWFGEEHFVVTSTELVPAGAVSLAMEFTADSNNPGTGGTTRLFINGKPAGEGRIEKTIPFRYTVQEGFDIGLDTVTPVSKLYQSPFKFTGTIKRVIVDVNGAPIQDLAKELQIAMAIQ